MTDDARWLARTLCIAMIVCVLAGVALAIGYATSSPAGGSPGVFVGALVLAVVVPQVAFLFAQALPDGRTPVWLGVKHLDGWTLLLLLTVVANISIGAVVAQQDSTFSLLRIPFLAISVLFMFGRTRYLNRLATQSDG